MAVQITATFQDLSHAVRKAASRQIEARANRYGEQMVSTVQRLINASFNTGRPNSRRRYPGSQHLDEGWGYKVAGDPTNYPLFVNLTGDGDGQWQRRVTMMNDGTPGHQIKPRSRKFLRYPLGSGAEPGPPWVYAKEVSHPGTHGTHFLEATREIVVGTAAAHFR